MNEGYVYFAIRGEDFDPDKVTEVIGIQPTDIIRKGIPHKGIPFPKWSSWLVSTEEIVAKVIDVYELSEQVVSILEHQAEAIGKFVKENNLYAVLEVVLWISTADSIPTPAIGFNRRVIEFVHKTGAVIDVDTYINPEDEE